MNDPVRTRADRLALYLTPEHDCSYLSTRAAKTLFVDPQTVPEQEVYQHLLSIGFRRSGNHVYRPQCPNCTACVPVRIPVRQFQPRRAQRRCWQRGSMGLQVIPRLPVFDLEQYALYQRYTAARHAGGGMADANPTSYLEFLVTRWCPTQFVELRRCGQLVAVAVTDILPNALSAVYTFFDPNQGYDSPGVFAILWQIQEARRRGLEHLYLGYWIGDCHKMSYKDQYRPLEAWNGQHWRRYERGEVLSQGCAPLGKARGFV
jgi:arginine-tRNA-protein transferase